MALVAEEFGRGLVDAPFLGPVLADDLARHIDGTDATAATVAVDGQAVDARGSARALVLTVRRCRARRSPVPRPPRT